MSTPHHLVSSSRVEGMPVFAADGHKLGRIDDLLIDKASGRVCYALMSFDGFLGMGQRYYPLPWAMLDYNPDKGGFATPLTRDQVEQGQHVDDKEVDNEIEWREAVHAYYGVPAYW
jgi:hypothetical protein